MVINGGAHSMGNNIALKYLAVLIFLATPVVFAQAPEPPILINPADGLTILLPSNQVPTRIFTWDPAQSGAPPTSYIFGLGDVNDPAANFLQTSIAATGGRVSTQQIIPRVLRGKTIRWSVSSCVGRPPNRTCSSPAIRIISWPSGLQAPEHKRPLEGEIGNQTGEIQRFEWNRVSGANYYLFCAVLDESTVCPNQSVSNNDVEVTKRLGGGNIFAASDLSRWTGRTIYWKPGACDEQDQCVWNDTFRSFTLLNAPQLINPKPDELIIPNDYRVVFTWSVVPGANAYILTVAKSGQSFDTPAFEKVILGGGKNNTVWNVPDTLRKESGGRLKWTVASCIIERDQRTCTIQRNLRWVQLALERGPLHYRVLNGFSGTSKYLYVTVRDKYVDPNEPVPGAAVCLGTTRNPTQYGTAKTNSDGYVVFPYVPESHYMVSTTVAGIRWFCKPGFLKFCAPLPILSNEFVHTNLDVFSGAVIGGINEPAQIRLRLNRAGPGLCPIQDTLEGDTGTSIDVDTF